MTNFDLEGHAKRLALPLHGVFSKDQLPPYHRDGAYIVNLQDSVDEAGNPLGGTHWTGFYIEKGKAVYFDPFGVIAPLSVQHFLRPFKPWLYSEKHIQNIRSEICGYYVLYFIWFMTNHQSKIKDVNQRFKRFLGLFSNDPTKNKTLLQKYIKPL